MEHAEEGKEAMMEFEESDEFSTASAGGEGRDRELMCNGRNIREGRNLEASLRAKD